MGRVVIYKGLSQYDALGSFADGFAEAFRALGKEVVVIQSEYTTPDIALVQDAFSQPCEMVISFNAAIGLTLSVDQVSLYDYLATPYVAILVDHPCHHLDRLDKVFRYMLVTCIDKTHVDFIQWHYKSKKQAAFLPHCGFPSVGQQEERSISVLMTGSYTDPNDIYAEWSNYSPALRQMLVDITDYALQFDVMPVEQAVAHILKERGFTPEDNVYAKSVYLLSTIDLYIRAMRRLGYLQVLSNSGITVDIYGSGWEQAKGIGKHRIHSALPFKESISLMKRAKIALNIGPGFPNGSHERVYSAMLNGAVCVSETNHYFTQEFSDGHDIVFIAPTHLEEVASKVDALLCNPILQETIANNALAIAQERHTCLVRAKELVSIVEQFKSLMCG